MLFYFVINPCAGELNIEQRIRDAISPLPQKDDCQFYITKSVGDARNFVKKTCEENTNEELRFIACGGDGTINEVFSGALGYDHVSVTCYPCGSGNDFVKVFGADKFLKISKLLTAPIQKLDVIKAGNHCSINVLNFGFDTTVIQYLDDVRKKTGHGSKRAYSQGIIKALIYNMRTQCSVIADGTLLNPDGQALLCTIANGKFVGGSFQCAPRAITNDGLMEVCLIKPISRLRFLRVKKYYERGEHLDVNCMQDIVVYKRAKKVEISAPEGFCYTVDGEIIYDSHFTVEILPGALDFACPT